MSDKRFYRYIIKNKTGTYSIYYKNEYYGTYEHIEDALHDRDILESCGWDIGEMNARDEIMNPYYDMVLPPDMRYIHKKSWYGKYTYYMIRKVIDGKQRFFGQFKDLNEAISVRDNLMRNDWRVNE